MDLGLLLFDHYFIEASVEESWNVEKVIEDFYGKRKANSLYYRVTDHNTIRIFIPFHISHHEWVVLKSYIRRHLPEDKFSYVFRGLIVS